MSGKNSIMNSIVASGYERYKVRTAGIIANPRVSVARARYDNAKQATTTNMVRTVGKMFDRSVEKHPKTAKFMEKLLVELPNRLMGRPKI